MSRTKGEKNQKQPPIEAAGNVALMDIIDANVDDIVKGHLPLIKCECGAETLLLSDLSAMNRAIRTMFPNMRRNIGTLKETATLQTPLGYC